MRLKRVELIGFKSFMDRTVLDFRDGITTILGPNGCGKSNVVDAVRWVLGEQRAKQLRGERMEDVIFKGSAKRKPLSVAEVSLVFDNSDGTLPMEFDEVAISRRVDRSGQSDYFLNKTPCRLKDIKDLFYDTGVGNNAYSVIEQEVVGQVLDPNENKVRAILEEGSGIVRYKVKRKEALRKLDLTERDLLRVEDIIEEIGKQVRSLARQVGKARRHQRLHGEVKSLEVLRANSDLKHIETRLAELREQSQALRSEGSGEDAQIARLRADVEGMKLEVDGLEGQRKERAHELSKVETELAQIEGELLVLREKIEAGGRRQAEIAGECERAGARRAEVQAEIEGAESEHAQLSAKLGERRVETAQLDVAAKEAATKHDDARKRLAEAQQMSLGFLKEEAAQQSDIKVAESRFANLQEREETLCKQLAGADEGLARSREELVALGEHAAAAIRGVKDEQGALNDAKAEAQHAEERWNQERELRAKTADELARAESRHEIADRLAREYEGYREGAASLLKDESLRGRLGGALAEQIRIENGYEGAFELVFGEDADALLVKDLSDARGLTERLQSEELGRASFLATGLRDRSPKRDDADIPGRPAMELIRAEGEAREHITQWLRHIRVLERASEAVDAALAHAGAGYDFLSRDGLFIRHDGLVRGGAGERKALSMFGRRDQVEKLGSESLQLGALLDERSSAVDAAMAEREVARKAVERAEERLARARDEAQNAETGVAAHSSVLERDLKSHEVLTTEHDEAKNALASLLSEIERRKHHLGMHGEDQASTEARVEQVGSEVEALEAERERSQALLAEARLALTRDEGHDRELESRRSRLSAMRDDLSQRLEHLERESERLIRDIADWSEHSTARQGRLKALFDQRETRREELRGVQADIDGKRQQMEALQQTVSELGQVQRKKQEALHELDTESTKLTLRSENLRDRLREKFQLQVEEAYAALNMKALPRELVLDEDGRCQPEQVKEILAERQERLDKLGPVNFVALDEYDAKRARLEFLETQRDDLLQSKEDLLKAIERINRTARQLFRDTFEQVRKNFQEIFATLFEGGVADLVLHKTEDPLESDVQIVAQPSGKRVDSVALLSGGERALTAISLLFSVYLIKPSPFCILDEVDAPLDDINVGRFVRLLQGFADRTQFVVITHNKLTMEAADHLYGVTMQESGVSRLVSVSFDELDAEHPLMALEEAAHRVESERPAARLSPLRELTEIEEIEASTPAGSGLEAEA